MAFPLVGFYAMELRSTAVWGPLLLMVCLLVSCNCQYQFRVMSAVEEKVDTLTHPYPTIACAARVVTGTAGRDRTTRAVVTTGTEGYNYT